MSRLLCANKTEFKDMVLKGPWRNQNGLSEANTENKEPHMTGAKSCGGLLHYSPLTTLLLSLKVQGKPWPMGWSETRQ